MFYCLVFLFLPATRNACPEAMLAAAPAFSSPLQGKFSIPSLKKIPYCDDENSTKLELK